MLKDHPNNFPSKDQWIVDDVQVLVQCQNGNLFALVTTINLHCNIQFYVFVGSTKSTSF
jgi:hypothetical protein